MLNKLILTIFFPSLLFGQSDFNAQEEFIKIWGIMKYETTPKNKEVCYWNSFFIESMSSVNKNETSSDFDLLIDSLLEANCQKTSIKLSRKNDCFSQKVDASLLDYTNPPKIDFGPDANSNFRLDNECLAKLTTYEEKLLAVARLWNSVYYFHPNRDLNYIKVLHEALSSLNSGIEIDQVLVELLSNCQDNHARITSPRLISKLLNDFYFPEIRVTHLDSLTFIANSRLYHLNNDTIISINEQPIKDAVGSIIRLLPTTKRVSLRNSSYYLLSGNKNSIGTIRVKGKASIPIEYNKNNISDLFKAKPSESLADNVVYVDFMNINSKKDEKKKYKMIKSNDTVFFDLRGHINYYPHWLLKKMKLKGKNLTTISFDKRDVNPFKKTKRVVKKSKKESNYKNYIIIDESTQSASEVLALQLSYNGCQLIGTNTSGAIGYTTQHKIAKKTYASYTLKKYINQNDFWAVGIQPKIIIPMVSILTPSEIRNLICKLK